MQKVHSNQKGNNLFFVCTVGSIGVMDLNCSRRGLGWILGKTSHNKTESLEAIACGGDGISFIGSFLEQVGQTGLRCHVPIATLASLLPALSLLLLF